MSNPINIPGAKNAGSGYSHNVSASYAYPGSNSSATSGSTTNTTANQLSASAPQYHRFIEDDVSTSPGYMRTVRFSSGFLWDEHVLSPRRSYMRPSASTAAAAATAEVQEVHVAEIRLDNEEADKLLPS